MIITSQHSVGTAAVQIASPDDNPQIVIIHNNDHSSSTDTFVGAADVSIANGMHIHRGETLTVHLDSGDSLFAVADDDDVDIRVLQTKR